MSEAGLQITIPSIQNVPITPSQNNSKITSETQSVKMKTPPSPQVDHNGYEWSYLNKILDGRPRREIKNLQGNILKKIFPIARFLPDSKFTSHILANDTLSCTVGTNGELNYKFFTVKTNGIPFIFERFWPNSPRRVHFVEEVRTEYGDHYLNGENIRHLSRNLDFRDVLSVHERVDYFFLPDNKVCTEKQFICDSFNPTTVGKLGLRNFGFWRWNTNEIKANNGICYAADQFKHNENLKENFVATEHKTANIHLANSQQNRNSSSSNPSVLITKPIHEGGDKNKRDDL